MSRYLVGLATGLALVFLLGAAGDSNPLEKRVNFLEKQFNMHKGQVDRANSRLTVLEARVATLEKKAGAGSAGTTGQTPAAPATPTGDSTKPAPQTGEPGAQPVPEDPMAAFIAERERKKVILGLRTADYKEVDGLPGLWLSPLEHSPAAKRKVLAIGKLRYIGEEDLAEFDLTLQIIYRTKGGRTLGLAEFDIPGKVLKPDKDYAFRQLTQLSEEHSILHVATVRYLKKTKAPLRSGRSSR